jgi:hypothetical protein
MTVELKSGENSYRIAGYIEHQSDGPGFITPVFIDKEERQYIQLPDFHQQLVAFILLADDYRAHIKKDIDGATITKDSFTIPIYGFKWKKEIRFLSMPDMKNYLVSQLLIVNMGESLAASFIEDQKLRVLHQAKGGI